MIETGLQGKTVLVTGCSAGIGLATARRFAQEGAKVFGWDLRDAPGDFPGVFQRVNVAESAEVTAAAADLDRDSGGVRVLINNAGILRDAQLIKFKDGAVQGVLSDEQWDAVLGVNLKGVFLCTRAIARHMIERGKGGVILNASSVVGVYGNFGQTNYVASKAGVIGMTKVWARELGKYGIRVNAVAPGFIQTEMTAGMPEKVLASMVEHTPIRRLGKPEDVAEAYLWLASDAASFVHGAVLGVDGGVVTGT